MCEPYWASGNETSLACDTNMQTGRASLQERERFGGEQCTQVVFYWNAISGVMYSESVCPEVCTVSENSSPKCWYSSCSSGKGVLALGHQFQDVIAPQTVM